ncbi:MAG: rod shape-determining protein MreC [Parvibaculaceae bacterium]|nr:rod shape-determining protein MreC [Parvibaculaceae bacterium]
MKDPSNRLASPLQEFTHRVSLIFMLTLAAALLLLGRAETYVFDQARQVVTDIAAPLLELASRPVAATRRLVERTDEYAYVFDENEHLRDENAVLVEWKEKALRLEAKIARYEALLNVQVDPSISYATGRVVGDRGGPFVETFIVNLGRDHGVSSGQAVVDSDGLIGRIVSTGDKASRILLLTDLNSRVPVVIEPTRYRAVLAGDNTPWPRVEYLPTGSGVAAGDRVVTSGHGGLMPAGLPVGVVIATDDGFLRVQTFSNRDRLDSVRVLQYSFPSEVSRQDPPHALQKPEELEKAKPGDAAPVSPAVASTAAPASAPSGGQ